MNLHDLLGLRPVCPSTRQLSVTYSEKRPGPRPGDGPVLVWWTARGTYEVSEKTERGQDSDGKRSFSELADRLYLEARVELRRAGSPCPPRWRGLLSGRDGGE